MILVCGEVLVDLVPAPCDGETGYLPRGGGSPYNVGIGLARLEVPVGFMGRVSRDHLGRMLRLRLTSNGVDVRYLLEGDESTTLAMVHLEPDSEPEFVFYGEGTADRLIEVGDLPVAFPDEVGALHFGSISLVREPGASAFEACMGREHGRRVLSLDPNVRPSLIADRDAYLERLVGWVKLADLVKISRADLRWLYPREDPEDIAHGWLGLGPALVVVTRGSEGATAVGVRGAAEVRGVPRTVVDTVGAGDAFTSGLLAWLHESGRLERSSLRELGADEIREGLAFADAVAALTCTRAGAEPPTRAELATACAV
jgi:fructokinase